MGTIRKQSILGTIYTYIGTIIGFVSTALLTPKILSPEEIGILSLIVAYASILATLANLGMSNVITRFFPYFRNSQNFNNGFFFVTLSIPFLGFIISAFIFLIIKPILVKNAIENIELLKQYFIYIIPFTFTILYFNILDAYYKMLYNVTLGSFLKELAQRVLILIALLLLNYTIINFEEYVYLYLIAFTIPVMVLVFAIMRKGAFSLRPQLSFIDNELKKSMLDVGLFGIIGSFTGITILNIDRIIVERMLGLSETGIYTIAFFFGTLVVLPSRPLLKISSAFIADSWKKGDLKHLSDVYYKSTITQLVIAVLLLIGIWANIDNIFNILPAEYESGKYVILFVGLAFLTDMFVGVGTAILSNSKHYRYQTYTMLILIILIILFNLIFIPTFGIVGAAFASFISKILSNTIRIFIIKYKFGMQPFNFIHIKILSIGLLTYLLCSFLPVLENYIFDIIYRSTIISIVFCVPVYLLKLSEDINEFVNALWKRFIH